MSSLVITGIADVRALLQASPAKLDRNVQKAVAVTARKIQLDARRTVGRGPYTPAYASSITYDVTPSAEGAEAEIGPDKGLPQGALGNLIEFGSRNNAPMPHLAPALERNAADLEEGVTKAVLQALGLG
jgi:hypothetical protein